jgi:hypothetical protein
MPGVSCTWCLPAYQHHGWNWGITRSKNRWHHTHASEAAAEPCTWHPTPRLRCRCCRCLLLLPLSAALLLSALLLLLSALLLLLLLQVLGTFITEWDLGASRCRRMFSSRAAAQAVADQLVVLAAHYGFEGWVINIENSLSRREVQVGDHANLCLWTKCTSSTAVAAAGIAVLAGVIAVHQCLPY